MPDAYDELMEILRTLEEHYRDMQDTEFTVEEGSLYMLQTRNAKRPAQAAVRFAVDAVGEGLFEKPEAIVTIDAAKLDALLHPGFAPDADFEVLAEGVAASPGAARGEIVFTADDAVEAAEDGRDVILVRPFTEADDVAGFHAAKGILTAEGGKASHAALVARGMGKPCVSGASALEIDLHAKRVRVDGTELGEGDVIAIDGSGGIVTADEVPLEVPEVSEEFETVLAWADELRTLGVRANADTPEDAAKAREFGAEGIGLCRTEHMFMAEDRQPKMRAMIMAESEEDRRAALEDLLRSSRRTSRACSSRWRACRSRSGCSTRRCTSSCRRPRRWRRRSSGRASRSPTSSPSWSTRSTGSTRCPRPTRCSAPAACASGSCIRRSTRCRSARSFAPRSPCPSRPRSRS